MFAAFCSPAGFLQLACCLGQTDHLVDFMTEADNVYLGRGVLNNLDRDTLFGVMSFAVGWGPDSPLVSRLGIA